LVGWVVWVLAAWVLGGGWAAGGAGATYRHGIPINKYVKRTHTSFMDSDLICTTEWHRTGYVSVATQRRSTVRVIIHQPSAKEPAMKTISIVKMQPLKMTRCGSYHAAT
jgi:hypothetical protein